VPVQGLLSTCALAGTCENMEYIINAMDVIINQRIDKPFPLLLTDNRQRFENGKVKDKEERTCFNKIVSNITFAKPNYQL
jgi:hypothetical protein